MNDLIATVLALPVLGPYLPYLSAVVAIAAIVAPFFPAPSGRSLLYAVAYRLVNLAAANVGHARNASDPVASDPPKIVSAWAVALFLPLLGLAACQADGTLKPGVAAALAVACQVDAVAQPVVVQIAPAVAPQVTAIAAVDQQLVHPAVQQACQAVNGKPVAVSPAGAKP